MKREMISQSVGNIDACYIKEAAEYHFAGRDKGQYKRRIVRNMIAAVLVLGIIVCGIAVLAPAGTPAITVYAYETDEEITAAGAVLSTGTISNSGEMKGKPLMFYLTGQNIETVRFSCRNQKICFMDWTEKRDEYGNAQNFTVVYGEDESEYYYLTIDWIPEGTIRELTDKRDSTIEELPDELREDVIVMEITFENGRTATKAVTVSLQDDGTFFARLDDYEIKEGDAFVKRPDSEALSQDKSLVDEGGQITDSNSGPDASENNYAENGIPQETDKPQDDDKIQEANKPQEADILQESSSASLTPEQIDAARQVALVYYEGTVFSVNRMEYLEESPFYKDVEGGCIFSVNVSKGDVVQEPDRMIILKMENDEWKVVNEGY